MEDLPEEMRHEIYARMSWSSLLCMVGMSRTCLREIMRRHLPPMSVCAGMDLRLNGRVNLALCGAPLLEMARSGIDLFPSYNTTCVSYPNDTAFIWRWFHGNQCHYRLSYHEHEWQLTRETGRYWDEPAVLSTAPTLAQLRIDELREAAARIHGPDASSVSAFYPRGIALDRRQMRREVIWCDVVNRWHEAARDVFMLDVIRLAVIGIGMIVLGPVEFWRRIFLLFQMMIAHIFCIAQALLVLPAELCCRDPLIQLFTLLSDAMHDVLVVLGLVA